MKPLIFPVTVLAGLVLVVGCCNQVDLEAHRRTLFDLNEQMRTAHLDGDIETVISVQAYPYTKVNSGRVTHPTADEDAERFTNYLSGMNITAWDDLIEPIITISDDATLATVIYRKRLVMTPVGQGDAAQPFEGIFAWQSTYRRGPEGWKQISDVLTSLPAEELATEPGGSEN